MVLATVYLLGIEIFKVYLIMPFTGSQESNTLAIAYFLHTHAGWLRGAGWIVALILFCLLMMRGSTWMKTLSGFFFFLYIVVFYSFNVKFSADKIFKQPRKLVFSPASENQVSADRLVIGAELNGEVRAYPIQYIGYHHQVRDSIAGKPILVTYCTVCRTGRVFSPLVNGNPEIFRLVGMDHYNALFEDATTKSWWRQATGEAVAGPRKGTFLEALPSTQMTLSAWLAAYPQSKIMQPDTVFSEAYEALKLYDAGKMKSRLEGRDSVSWGEKSWVVGVQLGTQARAYDWLELEQARIIQDTLGRQVIMVVMENDSATFHVFSRLAGDHILTFEKNSSTELRDLNTHSVWDFSGRCLEGELKGQQLQPLQAYQQYWHSWRLFKSDAKFKMPNSEH